jgi:hypothetical protein
MYKPSTYLIISFFSTYIQDLFRRNWLPRVKPNINSVEVHPQLSNKGHPVDGVLVGAGSLWLLCYPYGSTPPTSNWWDYWVPV